jgi:hypothetical protein
MGRVRELLADNSESTMVKLYRRGVQSVNEKNTKDKKQQKTTADFITMYQKIIKY